jgi:hypothetical protein
LAINISGVIGVANLPCASSTVPVAGAQVTAKYEFRNVIKTETAWTDKSGAYSISLSSVANGANDTTVVMTVGAESKAQIPETGSDFNYQF